jgi:dTDP-4-amino-4,6-dideoxygalactose transaminase
MDVPFLDLRAHNRSVWSEIQAALDPVMEQAQFTLGPAVERFEDHFAEYLGVRHCVGLNNGTSALHMALLACDVGPGDEVVTTPATWVSTAWAISYVGARPVFVDIDPQTYNLDPRQVERAITPRTRALLPVHLYGQAADVVQLRDIADEHGLVLIEDAAQAHGARLAGRRVGSFGRVGCFSFYPGKNLGAVGEAGHAARARPARRYRELLAGVPGLTLPSAHRPEGHVWHLFVVVSHDRPREEVRQALADRGIATGVHYPTPVPFQPAYADLGYRRGDFPVAEELMANCLSLPLFPELTAEQVERTAAVLREVLEPACV